MLRLVEYQCFAIETVGSDGLFQAFAYVLWSWDHVDVLVTEINEAKPQVLEEETERRCPLKQSFARVV